MSTPRAIAKALRASLGTVEPIENDDNGNPYRAPNTQAVNFRFMSSDLREFLITVEDITETYDANGDLING